MFINRRLVVASGVFTAIGISLLLSMRSTSTLLGAYKSILQDFTELGLLPQVLDVNNKNQNDKAEADDYNQKEHEQEEDVIGKDMNIVLFYADDWTWRTIGAVNKAVKTPHIDAMAKQGILFRHNCVTTSICWQSRATKVTGLYTAVHQQLRIADNNMFDKTVAWNQTLYSLLYSAGYYSGFVGKWHAPMPKKYKRHTWNLFRNVYGSHWIKQRGSKEQRHITEVNREHALGFLRQLESINQNKTVGDHKRPRRQTNTKKQKFALTISFFATHAQDGKQYPDQYSPQNYSEYRYRNETIPIPKTATEEAWQDMPWFFTDNNEGRRRWRKRYDTPEHYQVSMKRLYRMASEVDDVVGEVKAELKRMGYHENNTMFIFTTDNGNFHGEHGLADKWYPHEESIRVPLIIQDPRMPDHVRSTVNDEFTLNVDLAPTILSAAGLSIPKHMQGQDISQLYLGDDYEEAARNWRKDFFYEWSQGEPDHAEGHGDKFFIPAVYALVRKDYKYFYWPQHEYEQLFHIESDPFEELDIINTTLQTKPGVLEEIKARYAYLKNLSQRGYPV